MKSLTYGNFQIGMVDNPTVEDKGGFEFASGMDIFSEPGVMKSCLAMTGCSFNAGAAPSAVPLWMVDVYDILHSDYRAYVTAGAKLLESTDGTTFSLFLTNSKGTIKGLGTWDNQVFYPSDGFIGSATVGQSGTQNDTFYSYGSFTAANYYPVIQQAGTLKVAAGRYISTIDEALAVTEQAFKLPENFRINTLAEFLSNLYMGTVPLSPEISDSSGFGWRGIPLDSGSALPDVAFPMQDMGLNALFSDGHFQYAFVGNQGSVLVFQGSTFDLFRELVAMKNVGTLTVPPAGVTEFDRTILFGGDASAYPGVWQMNNKGAICQSFVPNNYTPGSLSPCQIGFVKTAFDGTVYVGFYVTGGSGSVYLIHRTSAAGNRQDASICRTLWHRVGTDKLKRWAGIKLNGKPLASCSVAVSYRTQPDAAFSSTVATITSANQDKPVIFTASPRSRQIQFQFKYTVNGTETPELSSYDPLFEVLNTMR